ncbi:MAG: hypothetical protein ACFFED_15000 [Candidatus Thorarchaeota archaeon]
MMEPSEILIQVGRARDLYNRGLQMKDPAAFEESLSISLSLRKLIDSSDKEELAKEINQFEHLDGGLNAHIFNCMKLLGRYEDILPYLERTLQYLNNDRNPDLWRQLGLLYLVQKKDLEKAVEAWKKAIELDSSFLERFPGLNVVYTYTALKSTGKHVSWKVIHADLETGEFSVSIGTD